jgi:hypothetical protein
MTLPQQQTVHKKPLDIRYALMPDNGNDPLNLRLFSFTVRAFQS